MTVRLLEEPVESPVFISLAEDESVQQADIKLHHLTVVVMELIEGPVLNGRQTSPARRWADLTPNKRPEASADTLLFQDAEGLCNHSFRPL